MKLVLVSKCSLDIEQYVEFKMSVLISPSKSLISSRWVTYFLCNIVQYVICACLSGLEESHPSGDSDLLLLALPG